MFQVAFLDAAGKEVGGWSEVPRIGGMWALISAQFSPRQGRSTAIPPTATSAVVRIRFRNACEIADVGFYRIPTAEVAEAQP